MKIGDRYMYLPDEVVMRVNEIEDDTVFLIPTHKSGFGFYGAERRATLSESTM